MAKLRMKEEWKLWGILAAVGILLVGYLYLVSRPPMEGGEYLWQVQEVVAPTELKLKGSGQTIRVRLIGLEVAESETATVEDMLRRELKGEWLRIKVLRETPDGIKEGFAYLSGEDIHARLIRLGLAKISRQDQGFDIRTYIELELEARAAKRGRWANSNGGAE